MPVLTRVSRKNIEADLGENEDDRLPKKRRTVGSDEASTFFFEGKEYSSYSEMVSAKRERNRKVLESTGLLDTAAQIRAEVSDARKPSQRGLAKSRRSNATTTTKPLPQRKSSRLAGVSSQEISIENEVNGTFLIRTSSGVLPHTGITTSSTANDKKRVNDGSPLSIEQASALCGEKWQTSVEKARQFLSTDLTDLTVCDTSSSSLNLSNISRFLTRTISGIKSRIITPPKSPSILPLKQQVPLLHANDENYVAKVTPDRIYSIVFHPSSAAKILSCGDKKGFLGIWNVDQYTNTQTDTTNVPVSSLDDGDNDGVHLFKVHSSPIANLQWNHLGNCMYSVSYDNTVRKLDLQSQRFVEVYANNIKNGMDDSSFWLQYGCLHPKQDESMFLTTSTGNLQHLDFRCGTFTLNKKLSERKINTVSIHPDGFAVATAGLDCTVRIWDIRKLHSPNTSSRSGGKTNTKDHEALATLHCGKSINSAFFSPSGTNLLCTTMANSIDIVRDAHLQVGTMQDVKRIYHDNITGRWLSTFHAQWHAKEEIFCVGSMSKPRRIEIFDGSSGDLLRAIEGDAMTSVSSRCCFHPSEEKLVVCGGNSSGRVVLCQE